MSAAAMLVVAVVREAGLRSAIAARLTLAGIDLVTAESLDRLPRRRPALLVLDPALDDPLALKRLWKDGHWHRIAIFADAPDDPGETPWLAHLDRAAPVDALMAYLGAGET